MIKERVHDGFLPENLEDLEPLLRRRAGHREIAGLRVYETRKEYGGDGE